MSRCELEVSGRLSAALEDLMRGRFGDVTLLPAGAHTTVIVAGLDPAAQRSLLTLLWDTGHDVVSMRWTP